MEDILKIIGFLYLLLTILGFFDLKTFYSRFGISINEYLTPSEILLISMDKLGIVILAVAIQIGFWLYVFPHIIDFDEKKILADGKRRPIKYQDLAIEQSLKSKRLWAMWSLVALGMIVSVVFQRSHPSVKFWQFAQDFFYLNFWIAMWLYMAFLQATKHFWDAYKNSTQISFKLVLTVLIAISLIFVSIWAKNMFVFSRYNKTHFRKSITIFKKDGSILSQNDSIKFLGKTSNYFFFWNRMSQATTVFPASEVRHVEYKK